MREEDIRAKWPPSAKLTSDVVLSQEAKYTWTEGPISADSFRHASQQITENTLHVNTSVVGIKSQNTAKAIACIPMVLFIQIFQIMSVSCTAFSPASPAPCVSPFALPWQRKGSEEWDDVKAICTEILYNL